MKKFEGTQNVNRRNENGAMRDYKLSLCVRVGGAQIDNKTFKTERRDSEWKVGA